MKNKNIIILLGLVIILGFNFYWFSLRPQNIRKECYKKAQAQSGFKRIINDSYEDCLMSSGLK